MADTRSTITATLIVLTLVCAALLGPFALSPMYLDMMRDRPSKPG